MEFMRNSLKYLTKVFIGIIFVLIFMNSDFPGLGPIKVFAANLQNVSVSAPDSVAKGEEVTIIFTLQFDNNINESELYANPPTFNLTNISSIVADFDINNNICIYAVQTTIPEDYGSASFGVSLSYGGEEKANKTIQVRNEYCITVNKNGSGTASASHNSAAAGTTITLTASPVSGHRFVNWTSNDVSITNSTSATGASFTMPSKAVTVTANFEVNPTYSITVNRSGGDSSCTAVASKSHAAKDEVITITATPGPGYRFVSWSCAHVNNISNNEQASTQLTMPPSDVTVTAIFEANPTYTITFDPNGSGATVTPTSGTTGTNGKLTSLPTPEWRGHAFDGWYTQETGGTEVTTSTVFSAGGFIYAHWHDVGTISYDVTLKVKNGSWDDGSKTDKTVNLWKYDNEDLALTLTDSDIPAVGNEPDNGFATGSWDMDPRNQTITSNRTFTYTYIKSRGIIQNYAAVLGNNVNTESSPTVMYGVYGGNPCSWRVIGYDIYGNEHAKKSGAMTLFASDYIGGDKLLVVNRF